MATPEAGRGPEPRLAAGLARFAYGLRPEDICATAAAHVTALTVDAIGCALAGWNAEETAWVLAAARRVGGDAGDSTVIGSDAAASPLTAVLSNAYLTTGITACDVYIPSHCHLTPEIVPTALAVAELEHSSGTALRTALTAGLEVTSRLLRGIDYAEFRRRGWHSPGVIGPVGAATAAGLLFGLDEAGLRTAMSLAVSQSAGTFAAWPTTAVKFHQARGAAAGLLAAVLAREGFTASPDPFESPDGGLLRAYAPGDPSLALADLGREWELEQVSIRLWPGATPVQALLTALLADGRPLPAAADVREAEIRVPPPIHAAHRGVARPSGTFEALLSFHYVAAATILHGRFGIDLTTPEHRADPELAAFIDQRVSFLPDDGLPRGAVEVKLTTCDGGTRVLRTEHALGTPQRPAPAHRVQEKFLEYATPRIGDAAADLLARLTHLDDVPDAADVARLTRPAACRGGGGAR
ncbi:MAG: MmgE/PrpD family protein [Trebonia sp.]